MNEQTKSHYSEEIVAAWREQLAEAAENPWLAGLLLKVGERILRRFTYFYEQLRTLSRRARRYIQRKLALKLSAAAFLLALSGMHVPVAHAVGIDVDGGCTLVDAIVAANTDAPYGGCTAGDGADIINLLPPGSTFTLDSVNNSDYGPTGLPVISSKITIEGNGSTIERGGVDPLDFRIIAVGEDGDLTLRDTTITGGRIKTGTDPYYGDGGGVFNYYGKVAILNNSVVSGNYAYNDGGGVANTGGEVTIENSLVSGNYAYDDGGGVSNDGGTVTIENSVISGNRAHDDGGGVENDEYYATVTINNSTISSNYAYNDGGGVDNDYGELTIVGSTISGNDARWGGGVANYGGLVTIENSAVSGNYAYYSGGGVNNYYYGHVTINESDILDNITRFYGGGVCNNCETPEFATTVRNSVVSGDEKAPRDSAVHFLYGSEVAIENSTISGNTVQGSRYRNPDPPYDYTYYGSGGGVANMYGLVTIENSTVLGNDAYYSGGGVFNSSSYGIRSAEKSTISGNGASPLDGVYNYYYGAVTIIENSAISGNDAQYGSGGGVANSLYVGRIIFPNGEDASPLDSGYTVNYYGGAVIIRDSTISGNEAHRDGGGVFNYVYHHLLSSSNNASPLEDDVTFNYYYGAVVIENSTISGNEAEGKRGREIHINGSSYDRGRGGGVFNGFNRSFDRDTSPLLNGCDCYGKAIIKDSAIEENDALFGGGVFNGLRRSGVATQDASPLHDGFGSYIYSLLTIENSTISGNKAQFQVTGYGPGYTYAGGSGGGVFNYRGAALVDHSTISGNEADNDDVKSQHRYSFGGAGGGVCNYEGIVVVLNDSTISGNIVTGGYASSSPAAESHDHVFSGVGGGLFNFNGAVYVAESAISGNIVSGGYSYNYGDGNLYVVSGGGGVFNIVNPTIPIAVSAIDASPFDLQENGDDYYWGEVVIENSTISGNTVSEGRSGYSPPGYVYMYNGGAGVFNHTSHTHVPGNAASGSDASPQESEHVLVDYGRIIVDQSTISGNIVSGSRKGSGFGGGVANYYGYVYVYDSTISDNTAGRGGGVANEDGEVHIDQSTISGNDAFFGGGVANDEGGAYLYHSTISDNTANRSGGGMDNDGGVFFDHSIVSGNTAVYGREVYNDEYASYHSYNLFGHDGDAGVVGFTPGISDTVPGIDIRVSDILDPLADNGGSTETHALVQGSKAINAGNPKIVEPDYDQRGSDFDRVVNEVVDIGAYEYKEPQQIPVGGFTSPAQGLEQLIPASGLLAAIIALATSGVALVKRRRN